MKFRNNLRRVIFAGLCICLLSVVTPIPAAQATNPPANCPTTISTANPNASPAAQAVLQYLWELPTHSTNRVIAGQFGAYGDGADAATSTARLQKIFDETGKWIGLTGMDYHTWDINHYNKLAIPNAYLIEQWQAGSLVTISWHAINPWTSGESNDWEYPKGSINTPVVRELITPGTAVNARWMQIIGNIADGLKELQDKGVVVIWRPFHEMNGEWFWWSRQTQADFSALWQHMYNYFTKERGLNNILWGFSPNLNGGKDTRRTDYYWPGDEYVDVVGVDKYMALNENPLSLDQWGDYKLLIAKCKPFGIFEFGPTPADAQPDSPRYDYTRLIRDIKNRYPRTVFFQAWEWHWALSENKNVKKLLDDPWIVTRDELPKCDAAE